MTLTAALALAGAVFLLSITPGPGVTTIVARALTGGFRPALWLALGITCGDLTLLTAACLGLAALAKSIGPFFLIVKWIGAAYLIYLGIQAIRHADGGLGDTSAAPAEQGRRDFVSGYLTTLGNPKPILFYGALLPTFVDLTQLTIADYLAVAGIVFVIVGGMLAVYAGVASRARQFFRSRRAVRAVNRTSGAVLIGSGVVIATR